MKTNLELRIPYKKKVNILHTAARLFIEQGYENTGMRQIAKEAGVSLSLANYHFGSKKELGIHLIRGHIRALEPYVLEFTSHRRDNRLNTSTWMRLNYTLMVQPKLYQFYTDTLLNDIYLEALTHASVDFEQQRSLSLDQMYWVLGDSYIPVNIERAMLLCPFTDLLDQDVPDLIIKYFMYHLSDNSDANKTPDWYVTKSREAVNNILDKYPHLYDIFSQIPYVVAKCI